MAPTVAESRNARLRALPSIECWTAFTTRFNPHPTRRSGATLVPVQAQMAPLFQSSPDPKVGCYAPSYHGLADWLCFNPHPTRRSGATNVWTQFVILYGVSILTRPEGRVLRPGRCLVRCRFQVSILTRPEGRVLPGGDSRSSGTDSVSILTRPEGRVLPSPLRACRSPDSFNPHPTRRSGAT